eukprot:Skav226062  [mRNA]  locus=scaffold211:406109:407468:- [translate_table: standard]
MLFVLVAPSLASELETHPEFSCFLQQSFEERQQVPSSFGPRGQPPAFRNHGDISVANVVGDPHVQTLDGHRYSLLKQGTFSLWHYSGVETEFHSEEVPGVKTVPVDWHVYIRCTGPRFFTKGLLLVDKSGGSIRQVLEITAQDCEWRARKPTDGQWTKVKKELISVWDGKDYVTGFNVTKDGAKGHNHVRLNLNTKNGKNDIAILSLSCRPQYGINLQMMMNSREDSPRFVDGEVKLGRKKLSTLQAPWATSDSEFAVHKSWQDLGGSEEAMTYLETPLEKGPRDTVPYPFAASLLETCTTQQEAQAKETCAKHLEHGSGHDAVIFENCVYDLCHGASEVAAELAAELVESSRAIVFPSGWR